MHKIQEKTEVSFTILMKVFLPEGVKKKDVDWVQTKRDVSYVLTRSQTKIVMKNKKLQNNDNKQS